MLASVTLRTNIFYAMSTTKLQSSSKAQFVNRFLSICDEDATVENYSLDANDSAISLQTDHYSEVTKVNTNKYKISEMINPDGSATVRNLLIQEDGTWIRKQEEIDDNGGLKMPRSKTPALMPTIAP